MPQRSALQKLADERHQQVMNGIESIHERLDSLNGRTRENEINVATLQERVDNMRPSRHGGIAGTIGGVIAGFLAGFIKQ